MNYLSRVLGLNVTYNNDSFKSIPNFILERYKLQKVELDGMKAIFIYPLEEIDSTDAIKKHMGRIQKAEGAPAVLILEHLSYRRKEYLLRDHIPFIVDGKQIYLPFMAVYLQERGDSEKLTITEMLPSAQLLLLYYIYHGCGQMQTAEAGRKLGFTSTSISRASKQLEEMGIVNIEKRGTQKILYTDKSPRELFAATKDIMPNPVKRTVYVADEKITGTLLLSGYSALSEYSILNPPTTECFAADSISKWEKMASGRIYNADKQHEIQLWRYSPDKIAVGNCVDRLSLALTLNTDRDERVESAREEMLEQVWRDIDGQRNK